VNIFKFIICAILPFSYLNFANRGVLAVRGDMAYKAGFKQSNKSALWAGGLSCVGKMSSGKNAGQRVREELSRPSSAYALQAVIGL
jgi:hypothetical protein